MKDYYAILGIPKEAGHRTIKKAYRKLARRYHPDLHQGSKAMEERFKEIAEAYEALSNPKRQAQDHHGGEAGRGWSDLSHASPGRGIADTEAIIANFMDLMRRLGGRRSS